VKSGALPENKRGESSPPPQKAEPGKTFSHHLLNKAKGGAANDADLCNEVQVASIGKFRPI